MFNVDTDAASDAVLMDLNGDGEEELCAIAPFHGDTVNIYEKKNGKFELAYTHPEKLEFLHAIFGGTICGKPTWIIGNRKGDRLLMAFHTQMLTGDRDPMPQALLDKHFLRKHGPNAYYGQKKK